MARLMAIGVLAGLFFSSTFVINRAISLQGGHWVWNDIGRYLFMFMLYALVIWKTGGRKLLSETLAVYRHHWMFWTLAGGIGFGGFYTFLTYGSTSAPGWVVAATWQSTILMSLPILWAFGRTPRWGAVVFSGLIFEGILLVNLEQATSLNFEEILRRVIIPVALAALCYPIGNQLLKEATSPTGSARPTWHIPHIRESCVQKASVQIFLMTMGALPMLLAVTVLAQPPDSPSLGQIVQTALVALFSGGVATWLFLFARAKASPGFGTAAVDATQSSEAVFSLAGEILILCGTLPSSSGLLGVGLIIVGIVLYNLAWMLTTHK